MNLHSAAPSPQDWQSCAPTFVKTLPVLDFPFEKPPHIYAPASTVLRIGSAQVYAHLWCYLRRTNAVRNTPSFDRSSLSVVRVQGMPAALERLSKWFRFRNSRPSSVERQLRAVSSLLNWADAPENTGRFEALLSDPDVALEALRGHHSYLRSRLQTHQITSMTAAGQDQDALACLSEIHGRVYKDSIEPLSATKREGTQLPDSEAVQEFASTLQAVFDSAAALVIKEPTLAGGAPKRPRLLRLSATDDSRTVALPASYSDLRLMELACVAFAGLAFVDSGANLSVLQSYEEPKDLHEQLARPDRVSLTQKAVKFRAGGKLVEVHLSATTTTRLRTFLRVRQALVDSLAGTDAAPMFIQAAYSNGGRVEPAAVRALDKAFLLTLRRRLKAAGASLAAVTLRQLRAFKQQDLARRASITVAAKLMGHSVETATKAYCKAQEGVRQAELGSFLDTLQKTVLVASEGLPARPSEAAIPAGACVDYGKPSRTGSAPVVQPDCSKVEGCFFCDNYRVHADGQDLRKLMSCRRVLQQVLPMHGDSVQADRVYNAVVDRIDALLGELKRRQPAVYEEVRVEVEEQGQLTRYWASKIQQLHLLGMLPSTTL